MKTILYALFMTSLLACTAPAHETVKPDPDSDETIPESSAPGFGTSKSRPEGTPFVFPAGVTLARKPVYDADCWSEARKNRKIKGTIGGVALCLALKNTNAYPVRVELPPGLIWVAAKSESFEDISQNGIIVKTVVVNIPAHAVELTWLMLCCINVDRSGSRLGDSFESQPILSNHPGMNSLTRQLARKKVNEEDYATEPTDAERRQLASVGLAVHDVERYGNVQPTTQSLLNQLPDAN